ncbi:hypothetical protein OAT16_00370 [Prolixibacteraceae bacterium]|nr:hypothetical protein [Prolixibacteraceae bacterium]
MKKVFVLTIMSMLMWSCSKDERNIVFPSLQEEFDKLSVLNKGTVSVYNVDQGKDIEKTINHSYWLYEGGQHYLIYTNYAYDDAKVLESTDDMVTVVVPLENEKDPASFKSIEIILRGNFVKSLDGEKEQTERGFFWKSTLSADNKSSNVKSRKVNGVVNIYHVELKAVGNGELKYDGLITDLRGKENRWEPMLRK